MLVYFVSWQREDDGGHRLREANDDCVTKAILGESRTFKDMVITEVNVVATRLVPERTLIFSPKSVNQLIDRSSSRDNWASLCTRRHMRILGVYNHAQHLFSRSLHNAYLRCVPELSLLSTSADAEP